MGRRARGAPAIRRLGGEPRNTDLLVEATDEHGPFLIAIEAKADEPFGETVADALAAALERKLVNPRSRGVERIQQLATLLGERRKGEVHLTYVRYQLLTALAGIAAAAARRGDVRTLLLIQEFRTARTTDDKHAANTKDLNAFIHRLTHGAIARVETGSVYGPLTVNPGPDYGAASRIFVGKVTHDLRTLTD